MWQKKNITIYFKYSYVSAITSGVLLRKDAKLGVLDALLGNRPTVQMNSVGF